MDHPSTLTTINDLGLLYRDLGKLAEAEQTFLRALAGRKQVLGPDHPPTVDTVNNLVNLYSFCIVCVGIRRRHRTRLIRWRACTAPTFVNLYRQQGRLDDANQASMQALAEKNGSLRAGSPINLDHADDDDDDALSEVSSGPPSLSSDSSKSSIVTGRSITVTR